MENGSEGQMILLIQIHNQPFHYFEFVKPIEDILIKHDIAFKRIHYRQIKPNTIKNVNKIIICGTSLKDNAFIDDVDMFQWIKKTDNPVLGICGGMHMLGLVFGESLVKNQEIGLHTIHIDKECFEKTGSMEVYELHNFCMKPVLFQVLAHSSTCPQIVKHPDKPFLGVLFHPEVRNKEVITSFINR